ncbi:MAG: NAD(P)-dependent oxidoreductase [Rhodospirillales bacterium]|nr:NAD(P)-dependent oxidoreductase [Rhodospirillales bacterium]
MAKIGFIGLGEMGRPMVGRLLDAGHDVTVWGRNPARVKPCLDSGAKQATSPAALTEAVDMVMICVTDTDAVEALVFGPDGIAQTATADKLLVDHSTIHPLRTREWADRLRTDTGMGWVDAPVSGGGDGAKAGTLAVMAGGDEADYARAAPVIDAYAGQLTHMGPNGAGQAAKACNQMIIGAEVAIIAEALNFLHNFGIDAKRLPDCLKSGWADSTVLQIHGRRMAAADYQDIGDTYIMTKDMNIACEMGRETGSAMPVANLVQSLYQLLNGQGGQDKGQIGLMWLYQQEKL